MGVIDFSLYLKEFFSCFQMGVIDFSLYLKDGRIGDDEDSPEQERYIHVVHTINTHYDHKAIITNVMSVYCMNYMYVCIINFCGASEAKHHI